MQEMREYVEEIGGRRERNDTSVSGPQSKQAHDGRLCGS